jgi:hypothetical protein
LTKRNLPRSRKNCTTYQYRSNSLTATMTPWPQSGASAKKSQRQVKIRHNLFTLSILEPIRCGFHWTDC